MDNAESIQLLTAAKERGFRVAFGNAFRLPGNLDTGISLHGVHAFLQYGALPGTVIEARPTAHGFRIGPSAAAAQGAFQIGLGGRSGGVYWRNPLSRSFAALKASGLF